MFIIGWQQAANVHRMELGTLANGPDSKVASFHLRQRILKDLNPQLNDSVWKWLNIHGQN